MDWFRLDLEMRELGAADRFFFGPSRADDLVQELPVHVN